ncbi:hypothetical protein JCM10212_002743 [Sporobolomyces blumeae]
MPATTLPPPVRGRPRSTSISANSPDPRPGLSLPTLLSEPIPPSPQQTHAALPNSLPFSFPSNPTATLSTSPIAPLGHTSAKGEGASNGTGWGHRPTLSAPGILSPLPLVPGAVGPRGGRHRRTQSVSPPGFAVDSQGAEAGQVKGTEQAGAGIDSRRSSEPIPLGSKETSGPTPATSSQPRLSITTGIGARLAGQTSPNSPTRSPRTRAVSATNSPDAFPALSTSPSGSSHFPQAVHHASHHGHPHIHPHTHVSSHAALLQGIRSHALPHSPTLDASISSHHGHDHDVSPLSTSPSMPHHVGFGARRLSGGHHTSSRPFVTGSSWSPSSGSSAVASHRSPEPASPPFGPTSPLLPHHPSPLSLELKNQGESGSPHDELRHQALDEAMGEAIIEHATSPTFGSPPAAGTGFSPLGHGRRRSNGSFSPPLLPLPCDFSSPLSPGESTGATRSRSGSITRAVSSSASPASLYLEEEIPTSNSPTQPLISSAVPCSTAASVDIVRPPSPPLFVDTLFPTSGPLPPPSQPTLSKSPPTSTVSPPKEPKLSLDLAPPVPPPSSDPATSSSLGLPHLAIPTTTSSPIGTPEHLEDSLSPSSPQSSYFSLAPGAALARSPTSTSSALSPVSLNSVSFSSGPPPPLERAPSWEDELDDDEFDTLDPDGSGEICFSSARRSSSGTKSDGERVSLLEALGISKTDEEREQELAFSAREAERRRLELEEQARERAERAREAERAERERDNEVEGLGFMEVDLSSNREDADVESRHGEEEESMGVGEAGDLSVGDASADVLTIDEESLSALERIFVCAKSEAVEERARVAHFLADWLPAVEICEAVEYVLPLLAGLIEDEMVKEVFAPQLDRIMWHFFSHCPLAELDSSSTDEASSYASSPVPSRYKPRSDSLADPSPASSTFPSDRSDTPPPTSETSPSQSHGDRSNPDIPRISATTFTALLGALLTDQSTTVAKTTELALVRFLCRLKDKPVPPDSPTELPSLDFTPTSESVPLPALAVSEPDVHPPYVFTTEARQILEDEVVSGIVLGLARLDEDEHDAAKSQAATDGEKAGTMADLESSKDDQDETVNPILFMSPEEHGVDEDDEDMKWLSKWSDSNEDEANASAGPGIDTWGAPLVSFYNGDSSGGRSSEASEPEKSATATPAQAIPEPKSTPDQVFSSFSPDQPGDEEASIGKMVSMSLIGAIAAADCLEATVLVDQFLPEVERMKGEAMFYVRKEAVQALGHLSSSVPVATLESMVLPLHAHFSRDQLWHVRRAAVLALPSVCKPLPRSALRVKAVEAIEHFGADDNRNVRSGALEIAGELIYLFHEDPDGVPEELLSFFLGKPSHQQGDTSSSSNDSTFSPFKSALESPTNSFLDTSSSWNGPGFFQTNRDADRQILTAFNFPAVVLTLGRDRWNRVKDHHHELCKDPVEKARQSLASSLHEVAKIIGPEQADACLLEPLSWFLRDADNIQAAVLENLPALLLSFTPDAAKSALGLLSDAWPEIRTWRLREHLLKKLADFGPHHMQTGSEEDVLLILVQGFKDSVASVREAAVTTIPPLLNAVLEYPEPRAKLLAYLSVFRSDASYRNRVAYVSTVVACVRASVPRDVFEAHFLDALVDLARDRVVSVRIAVARAISLACECPALYADPASRPAIRELLSILTASPDRDVRLPAVGYHNPSLPASREASPPSRPSSPPRPLPSLGQSSSLQLYDDDAHAPRSPNPATPQATKPNPFAHGVDDDPDSPEKSHAEQRGEDSEMAEDDDERPPSTVSNEDTEMDEDERPSSSFDLAGEGEGVLLERPSPSPGGDEVWTRDDGEFVEISRR